MVFFKKIEAGALQYVLVIAVIIGVLIFAFISLIYLQQRMTIKHQFAKEAIANTELGFEYIQQKELEYNKEIKLDFLDNTEATTTITKKHWGIFDLAIVRSKVKNETFQKVGLLGTQNVKRDALYLQDNNQALVLVGKTKIIGNVSLPKQGVKSGNIAGTSYDGNQLIYGATKTSNSSMPRIKNSDFLKNFSKNFEVASFKNIELEEGLKFHQSFYKNTLLYKSANQITLENMSLSGNILIISKTSIKVASTTQLEDVILMAPKIIIDPKVEGNFQAIATKNIKVAANCLLRYPSALILLEKEISISSKNKEKEENQLTIEKNTTVKGIVLFYSEKKAMDYKPQISIQENATVTGEVYCTKNVELLGTVFGSVYTNNFITNQFGSIYINHIYNGVINSKELPIQYAGLQIDKTSNSVAKWVH
ncbi:MAG: hypothetical protein ACWIPJ_06205 [Polaribacter sp.]